MYAEKMYPGFHKKNIKILKIFPQ